MQELRAQYPVFLAFLTAHAKKLPWRDEKDELLQFVVEFHVGSGRHFDFLGLSVRIEHQVEFDLGECPIRRRIVLSLTIPQRLSLLALESVGLQSLDKLHKGLLRSHGVTHPVVEDDLLIVIGNTQSAIAHFLGIRRPVLLVCGLLGPN